MSVDLYCHCSNSNLPLSVDLYCHCSNSNLPLSVDLYCHCSNSNLPLSVDLYCHCSNSNLPLSVRLISTHPQNIFLNVHSLSPCRTKTTLYCDIPHTFYKSCLQTSVCSAVLYTVLTLVQNSQSLVSSSGNKSKPSRYPQYSDVQQRTFYLSYLYK